MPDYEQTAQDYIDVWNEPDADKRAELAERVFSADVRYTDPLIDVSGVGELLAAIAEAQQQFPGFGFRLVGRPDGHHDQLRFTWSLGPDGHGDDDAPVIGFDVATLDGTGRIDQVLGFLDRVPG